MNWRWWKRVEEEAKQEQEAGQEAAQTGQERLDQVRELAARSDVIRKKDEKLRDRNQFADTFMRAFKEGLR